MGYIIRCSHFTLFAKKTGLFSTGSYIRGLIRDGFLNKYITIKLPTDALANRTSFRYHLLGSSKPGLYTGAAFDSL